MEENKIQWHPAFADALKLELEEYEDALEIEEEYQLTSKPLEIDIIIVKKVKNVEIVKNIAKIFKTYNIIEYKSPDDYISIDDYYKVKAYAYLYKVKSKSENSICINDLTITMVSSVFPAKLSQHLKNEVSLKFNKVDDGIYYLEGSDLYTQFIIIDELPQKVNRFIKLLTKRASIKEEISMLLKDYAKNSKNMRIEHLVAILEEVNLNQVMEVMGMAKTLTKEEEATFEKLAEKFKMKDRWMEKGIEKGIEKGEVNSLIKLLNKKFGSVTEELKAKISKEENIKIVETVLDNIFIVVSIEEVEEYFNSPPDPLLK